MSDDNKICTVINFCAGFLIAIIIFNFFPGTLLKSARTAIEDCENTLPRNQYCIITAIPETQK